jgi:PDGLE domain
MKRVSTRRLVAIGLFVTLVLAGVVSFYASSHPDGLNYVAAKLGFSSTAQTHRGDGSPFAGYATKGIGNARLSGGLAGVVGVLVVGALGGGLAWIVRRRGTNHAERRRY